MYKNNDMIIQIEILNPKAKKLIEDLASLNLIRIAKTVDKKTQFKRLLKKFRSAKGKTPTLDEITKEVELVRKKRYAKKS